MIELADDTLHFRFPEVHPRATLSVTFHRTLRLPDDGTDYPLPPGLGEFPLRHVDDFAGRLPEAWARHGGVLLPVYQAEALWLGFSGDYPCALKVAAGMVNAVTGEPWREALSEAPQDYLVAPEQPWLDGFVVARGGVRQFVAMPLGSGYTAEEQIAGAARHGGLQLAVWPMRGERYEALRGGYRRCGFDARRDGTFVGESELEMGLAPGGRTRQALQADRHGLDAWQHSAHARCFVHLAGSLAWRAVSGENPPGRPPTAEDYSRAGLPWFDWYDDDRRALAAAPPLAALRSVGQVHLEAAGRPLPGDASPATTRVEPLHSDTGRRGAGAIRPLPAIEVAEPARGRQRRR